MSIIEKAIQEINSRFGVSLSDLVINGKIQRGPQKAEHVWYVGHEWTYNSYPYMTIKYGSWKHEGEFQVNSWDYKDEDKNFKKAYSKHVKESKVQLDLEKQERQEKCRNKWKPIYDKLPSAHHDYLKFKGIEDFSMSRISGSVLVVPAYNSVQGFVGVQQIYLDPETEKFAKKFSSGIEIRGAFCPLKPFKQSEYAYVCEGFATGKSIQLAFPDIPVIVVFSAGNIQPAIEHIRNINPKIKLMIAADNDKPDNKGRRAGEFYAKSAATKTPNCTYRMVKFSTPNNTWTDYNDLHQFESLEAVQEQLRIDPAEFTEIICLGFKGDCYFYTSSENTQIISLTSSAHANKMNLLSMVALPYWYKNYGIKDPESGDYIGIDYVKAAAEMMEKCRKKGFFDPDKMRGRGTWIDESRIIVNTGENIYEDGRQVADLKTKFHYIRTAPIDFNLVAPLSDSDSEKLLAVFGSLRYKNKSDYMIIAAWLVQANLFAVLPWRFHCWVSGEKGTGKSTILKWMDSLLIRSSTNLNSSAAGIRQDIESDTIPVLYDESEPDGFRLKEVIEMARQSSSNDGFETRRGTPSGKALVYNTQALFMMGSIQKGIEKEQDLSRFFIVELTKEKQSLDEYDEMLSRIEYFSKKKRELFSRCALNANTVLKSFYICQRLLKEKKVEARYADQISSMISCFWLYLSRDVITADDIENLIETYDLLNSEYMEQNKTPVHESCFDAIMAVKTDNQGHSVFHCLDKIREGNISDYSTLENLLGSMGIRYFKEINAIFIANGCKALKNALPEFTDYTSILKRDVKRFIPPSEKYKHQQRISNYGDRPRGIFIKL